ncbi:MULTISPECIES: class I SAM-dependent methyltransferase [Halolamina]|uniref:Methyltransferase domain-containing protein n=1 Tax=Halolamina pelagica TaxID=699431 RepID=A0A1I5Q0W0_9EURY|nr:MULTISPECIES: class I SAM-dependent methyltransferase [Halolamina]NHX35045.1 class I SAM-dependent methyltransferase [Halolamina sp. R1-12]SFP39835.1 Methyltransferase domain-containing protein [Halolamina pelagica]
MSDTAHRRRIRDGYRRWARLYDWFARATRGVGGVRPGCVDALDLAPGDTVVEFGCGPGPNLAALREAVGPTGRVVGVDVTGRMLDRAQALVSRRGWENVSLVQGDATTPPVAAADAVLATFVTSLFPDPYAVVSEWCEIADSVVVAGFAPRGNRAANAALWGFTQVNTELFDAEGANALDQLAERTAASRRALDGSMDAVESETYLFGTVTVSAGRREA